MNNNSSVLRAVVGLLLAALMIFLALKLRQNLIDSKEKTKVKTDVQINKIYSQVVNNGSVPVSFIEKGNLQALNKLELYSEVQGILLPGTGLFKPGRSYQKGDMIFKIDDSEFAASLTAQKSNLYNLIAQIMPDLRLDYPEVFDKWQQYLNSFDIKRQTPPLPNFNSEKEKFFINSKNIVTTFYNIKNQEERHKKYRIYAPYYGLVTESLVNTGTLVRVGQKMGTLIDPSTYEMAVSIDESFQKYIKIGKQVSVSNLDHTKTWKGKISRIDPTINTNTQGIIVYVQVVGKGLKEGMFLEIELIGSPIENAFEIDRKLLLDDSKTFIIEDNKLKLFDVDIALYKGSTAIATNLPEGVKILKNAIPGAYEGMIIEEIE